MSGYMARTLGFEGPIEAMTLPQAMELYQRGGYWRFDDVVNQAVATKLLDMAVNMGSWVSVVQRAVNTVVDPPTAVDGAWGPDTLDSINTADPGDLLQALADASEDHYRAIAAEDPSQQGFLTGWIARARKLPTLGLVAAGGGGLILVLGIGALILLMGRKKRRSS